jgi:hypothetical protein
MATGAHLYYFACDILWDALSVLRYLLEEGAVQAGPRFVELFPFTATWRSG